jgi:exosortase H (IPTLxxWG-CTERM-specific)
MKRKKKPSSKEELSPKASISIKRFAITYLILMGIFFLLIGLKPIQDIIDLNGLYTHGVVIVTSKVFGIIGIPCTYQGSIIRLPSIALDVLLGCNGLEAVMIYSVAVIAFPATWKKKIIGIIAGFLIIQIINIMRIAALAYAGVHFKSVFEYIHIYVAQGMMIAVSLITFFIYLSYAKSQKRTTS